MATEAQCKVLSLAVNIGCCAGSYRARKCTLNILNGDCFFCVKMFFTLILQQVLKEVSYSIEMYCMM
jgi:hypothetical protein